jgi:hypothetical protein
MVNVFFLKLQDAPFRLAQAIEAVPTSDSGQKLYIFTGLFFQEQVHLESAG